jgi:hypothetical protein
MILCEITSSSLVISIYSLYNCKKRTYGKAIHYNLVPGSLYIE